MLSKLTPVNMTDEMMIQTLNYLNRNPKACFDETTTNCSITRNYFKRNFDWSCELFDERLSSIGKFSGNGLLNSKFTKEKTRKFIQ